MAISYEDYNSLMDEVHSLRTEVDELRTANFIFKTEITDEIKELAIIVDEHSNSTKDLLEKTDKSIKKMLKKAIGKMLDREREKAGIDEEDIRIGKKAY